MIRRRSLRADDPIEALLRGEEPEFSEAARRAVINAYFFRDPELPPDVERAAGRLLDRWHEEHPPGRVKTP